MFYTPDDRGVYDYLIPKLQKNNFKIITTDELTKENLNDDKYHSPENYHPTEDAWDLITPLFAEKLSDMINKK